MRYPAAMSTPTPETRLRIVTHAGGAHADEVLACAVLLAAVPGIVRIDRRNRVEEADFADPGCFVLDLGGRLEPDRRHFDHHQLDRTAEPACTFSLVLRWLNLESAARAWFPWFDPLVLVDAKGNEETSRRYGWPPLTVERLESPAELALRDAFASRAALEPGDPLWDWLAATGAWLLEKLNALEARWALFQKTGRLLPVGGFQVLFFDLPPDTPDPGLGLDQIRLRLGGDIAARVAPDPRGAGYAMKRFGDDPRLDFGRLAGDPRIAFIHSGGFMATTLSRLPVEELLALLKQAAGEPPD